VHQASPRATERLRDAILAIELVAGATLVRSIAYDRWITVLASVLLLVGAAATVRSRTWGVALALAAGAAFPVAWAIGIAPPWFCLVGIVGAMPFGLFLRDFVRFDARATALMAAIATSLGAAGAILWKQYALAAFMAFPILTPSLDAHHGLAIAALLGAGMFARSRLRGGEEAERTVTIPAYSERRVRIASEPSVPAHDREDRATDVEAVDSAGVEAPRQRRFASR
jgi:hypothetical protein